MASTASERKDTTTFTGGGRGAPMIVPHPCPSGSIKLSIRAFIWGIYFFCTSVGSVRNWSKAGRYIVFVFTFIWIWPRKISKTTRWIFQICRDCDQENICIPKLNVLYQISLSEDFKNIFLFIIMSSNHEKMSIWNKSIWVGGPCRTLCKVIVNFD